MTCLKDSLYPIVIGVSLGFSHAGLDPENQNLFLLLLFGLAHLAWIVGIKSSERYSVKAILAWAIVLRALCLLPGSYLSTDIYRYLWEGRQAASLSNPWLNAPENFQGITEDRELLERVDHKHLAAIYQPTAMFFLALSDGYELRWRLIAQACELVCLFLIYLVWRAKALSKASLLSYAWMPLVLIEVSLNAHIDVVQMMFLCTGLYFFQYRKLSAATLVWSLGFMTKFWTLMPLAHSVWSQRHSRFDFLRAGFLALAPCVIIYALIEFIWGGGTFDSLKVYLGTWQFNGPIFSLLKALGMSAEVSRSLCSLVLAGLLGLSILLVKDIVKFTCLALSGLIYFSATVYPWYFLCLCPFIVFLPNPVVRTFIASAASFSLLSYEVLSHPSRWELSPWLLGVEYGIPPLLALAVFKSTREAVSGVCSSNEKNSLKPNH